MSETQNAALAVKLYTSLLKLEPGLMFLISRSCDFKVVAYKTLKLDTTKLHPKIAKINFFNFATKETSPVSDVLVSHFFGFTKLTHDPRQPGRYFTSLNALPDRKFTIRVKSTSKRGKVSTLIDGEKCYVLSAHMELSFNLMGAPDLKSITINGLHTKTQQPRSECITVTQAMRERFDIKKICTDYMFTN